MKYKIKNCRGIFYNGQYCGDSVIECKDCDDCLLKQIVQTCKTQIKFCQNCSNNTKIGTCCESCIESGETSFARRILSKLEIEEVNE